MSAPSLDFVAGVLVAYFFARVIDRQGKGGIFLPVAVLILLHGSQALPAGILGMIVVGALLAVFEAVTISGGGNK